MINSVRFVQLLRCAHKGRTCPVWSYFVRGGRPFGVPSYIRPSVGFIQFAFGLGSFYADSPHKRNT